MIDLLLTNGTVLTMNAQREILFDGAVAIDKGRLLEIGPSRELAEKYRAAIIKDCENHAVLPGLIDAHGHGGHCLLKGVGLGNDSSWMELVTDIYMHAVTDEFWYYEGKLSALERLKAGITAGVSVMGSMPRCDDPVFAQNHARAYRQTGLREVVCTGPCNPPWPRRFTRWKAGVKQTKEVSYEQVMDAAEAVIQELNHADDDMVRAFITPFVIVTSLFPSGMSPADLLHGLTEHDYFQARRVREIAEKYRTRIHSDAFGGMIYLAAQDKKHALLGPDVHLQHCTGLSFDETRILAESGTNVSCSPWTENAHERTPVVELLELGTTVAIATDGTAPNVTFDLFQAARKMQAVQQFALRDYDYLPPEKLLEMITIDAARCIGWDDELGSLEAGKRADVILVNMSQPHFVPRNKSRCVDRLIYCASAGDVADVIVNGRFVMKDRQVLTVDENTVMREADLAAEETIRRAGAEAFAYPKRKSWGRIKEYGGIAYRGIREGE